MVKLRTRRWVESLAAGTLSNPAKPSGHRPSRRRAARLVLPQPRRARHLERTSARGHQRRSREQKRDAGVHFVLHVTVCWVTNTTYLRSTPAIRGFPRVRVNRFALGARGRDVYGVVLGLAASGTAVLPQQVPSPGTVPTLRAARAPTRLALKLAEELLRVAANLHRAFGADVQLDFPPRSAVKLQGVQE